MDPFLAGMALIIFAYFAGSALVELAESKKCACHCEEDEDDDDQP